MGTVLAYTSPALGHLLPMCALLAELRVRGHEVHVRTLRAGLDTAHDLGIFATAIDPRLEEGEPDDWKAPNARAALEATVRTFTARAELDGPDLRRAVEEVQPDVTVVDINSWGALCQAESHGRPWVTFSPYTPPLRSAGVPPFGPGLKPKDGPLGRLRDAALRPVIMGAAERLLVPRINQVRTAAGLPAVGSAEEFFRRTPRMLVATGEPFEYPHPDWGEQIVLIGPCVLDPDPDQPVPDWLQAIDRPIVLVTTSSEFQADARLVTAALEALRDEPVHVVATVPAGVPEGLEVPPHATVRSFVPHGPVLDRAVCALTHGGMGATQKALARAIPVCVVPFGRDQFEVARRVEVAGAGTRLPSRRLTPERLREQVRRAMTMTDGARRVAEGYVATGGTAYGAEVVEREAGLRPTPSPAG